MIVRLRDLLSESIGWIIIATIFITVTLLQRKFYIDADPSWLIHTAWCLLHGGDYQRNFFEVDPPMAIYLYLIPAWMAEILHASLLTSLYIYTYFCEVMGILICGQALRQIFLKEAKDLYIFLQVIVAIIIIFLPGTQFAQRQHFLVIFTLPYLFLAYLRITEQSVSRILACIIGFLAGIGFAIKPYYLVSLVLVEIYLFLHSKTYRIWFRPEAALIALVFVSYAISLFILTPEYLYKVIPQIWHIYYADAAGSLGSLIIHPVSGLLVFTILLGIVTQKQCPWYKLIVLNLLISIGFWVSYILQRAIWYNHILPYVSYAFLFLAMWISIYYKQGRTASGPNDQTSKYQAWLVIIAALIILIYPLEMAARAIFLSIQFKKTSSYSQIIEKVKQLAQGQPIYFFTRTMALTGTYPMVDYANVYSASRFPSLWMSAPLYGSSVVGKPLTVDLNKQRKFLREAVIEDLLRGQPRLILVALDDNAAFPPHNYKLKQPDFIKILRQDVRFEQFWQGYNKVTTIDSIEFYLKKN